jgi:hypothetical protein
LTKRENIPRATSARTSSKKKKKPALPLARAERKPLDQKKKPAPRHQRAKNFIFNTQKDLQVFMKRT